MTLRQILSLSYLTALLLLSTQASAQRPPLYLVNGKEVANIDQIPPAHIEKLEELPADEQTIARYGDKAQGGVILVTLRYDQAARFTADSLSFDHYIARQVAWGEDEAPARVVARYEVSENGAVRITQLLEATDKRLKRRVEKAVEQAPLWQPALKNNLPVKSQGVLHVQLPLGKAMPRPVELVWR